jgi:hypothetical protein
VAHRAWYSGGYLSAFLTRVLTISSLSSSSILSNWNSSYLTITIFWSCPAVKLPFWVHAILFDQIHDPDEDVPAQKAHMTEIKIMVALFKDSG